LEKLVELFKPFKVKNLELKNRIVMPPMRTNLATAEDEMVTQRLIDHYVERAKGGVGLIIVEHAEILPKRAVNKAWKPLYIGDDKRIAQLKKITDAVHDHGANVGIQLLHWGRLFPKELLGHDAVAPSPIPASVFYNIGGPVLNPVPQELRVEEIHLLAQQFAQGAKRAKDAGFDMVEMHFGHGYLVHLFFSPYTNKRTDEYGGKIENRVRFAREILELTRAEVGNDFPISVRISGDEYIKSGMKLEETKVIAGLLEAAGADMIHVSAGAYPSDGELALVEATATPPMSFPRGCFVHLAEEIKKHVSVPVIAVGRINDPVLAEKILVEKKADLISIGRGLFADPQLPNKAASGRLEEIRKCLACNRCIDALMKFNDPELYVKCSINASSGKERDYRIMPVDQPGNVLVVGGGPAGMEAARVAAMRGHMVCLHDANNQLGGLLNWAVIPPHKGEINNLIEFLSTQLSKLGVEIVLNSRVTPEIVDQIRPDAVVVASGAVPIEPEIPGYDQNKNIQALDVLSGKQDVESKTVVIIGGGLIGCETAEYLCKKNKHVYLIEMQKHIACDVGQNVRPFLIKRLYQHENIHILTTSRVSGITSKGVSLDKKGKEHFIDADVIVAAIGLSPNNSLIHALKQKHPNVFAAGDCVKPRRIMDAIHEGYLAGLSL
jgi:2,4-dienoyl-CoA reductase-like NADH-dependent reductase (Old Yellow Enzyme family)/thioredoxin reductase